MSNQKEIFTRIKSINVVRQMTKTMKMISVVKYNFISKLLKQLHTYMSLLEGMQKELHCKNTVVNIERSCEKKPVRCLLIPISSDKGFCGNFNNNIYKKTLNFLNDSVTGSFDIYPIGKKISDFLTRQGIVFFYDNVFLLKKFDINTIGIAISNLVNSGKYDEVFIVYNHFISVSKNDTVVKGFTLKKKLSTVEEVADGNFVFFEPIYDSVVGKLHDMNIKLQIIMSLVESCAAEHGSRMVNMSKSTDNADVLLKKLRVLYNQMRQAAITNEIIEISTGYKNI